MASARDTKVLVEAEAETALDAIYREHFEFVWSVLRRLGVDESDVDDASQDVFVIAHRRLSQFEGRAAVRTWLYSIAMRVAANRRRKHARRDALLVRMPGAVSEDLEELAARGQARAILERLLDRLDEHKRVVFVLAELEELTVPAIADLVGENPRTIYSRLRAARAAVANDLDRLHAPQIDLGAAIVATRPRAAVEPERARRAWAAVLAKIGLGGSAVPVVTTGLALWGKIAIAAGVTIGVGTWAALPEPSAPTAAPAIAASPAAQPDVPPATEVPSAPVIAATASPTAPTPIAAPAPRVAPRHVEVPDPPAASTTPLADEIAAIDRARALVASDPEAALAELDRYDTRFARGTMQPEAARVRVTALCKAGRDDDARRVAAAAGLPAPRCS